MKSHRYGVWGLALGAVLLSAACDDKTEVVIPEPVPDPITVAVTPASLTLEVGQTAQFVATVSGGAQGTARTVTWASSNASIATIDANGVVTAVAPGVTTVTATSTADNTARGAAAVTVADDGSNAPVTLSIKSITSGNTNAPVDINNARGQLDVTLNLEGSPPAVISRVETLIDGTVVCSQSFSTGSADVSASDEAQAAVEIVCSVASQAYNETTGETTWKNGPHNLQARAIRPNGEVVATPSTTLIFNNTNFLNVTFEGEEAATSIPAPRSLATAGSLWHSGLVTINLLSVNYGAASDGVAQATVALTTSGYGVTGLAAPVACQSTTDALTNPTIAQDDGGIGPAVDPDGAGPLLASTALPGCGPTTVSKNATFADNAGSIEFSAGATMAATNPGFMNVEEVFSIVVNSVTQGGQAGPVCINPNPVNNPQNFGCTTFFANPLRVDNLAPRVTQLSIERAPNQYFGPNVFNLSHAAGGTTPACTAPCARTVDYGVGGQTTASTFLAGAPASPAPVTSGGAELDETATSNDLVFGLELADLGGNERTVYATMVPTTIVTTATNAAARRFGWDATAPTLEIVAGPDDRSTNPDETDAAINPVQVGFLDSAVPPAGPSGFLADPLRVKLERILPGGVTCHNPDTFAAVSCTTGGGFVMDDGTFPTPGAVPIDGYFRYTFSVADAAGNTSEQLVLFILEDVTPPTVGGVMAPSTITGGQAATFTADIGDNVDLGRITPYVRYDVVNLQHPAQVLGVWGEPLLATGMANVTVPAFMRSFQLNNGVGLPGAGPHMAAGMVLEVRDRAGQALRYDATPWMPAPNDGVCPDFASHNSSVQNCTNRESDISTNVLAGLGGVPVAPQFDDFTTMNGLNPDHGLFIVQAPSVNMVCNNTERTDCPAATTPLTTTLTATLTGPAGTFANPFTAVRFYYLNPQFHFEYIGSAGVTVSDNTVSNTRTYTFTTTWDVSSPKVRPAGAGGTGYEIYAVGVTAAGDGLGAAVGLPVVVYGN